ncbi:hypothetical protein PQX77_017686 [Marasmius sp. AFHP31]|nr:hypothetical protein PQX77_017686 [Marasmius sp. AFHP31]
MVYSPFGLDKHPLDPASTWVSQTFINAPIMHMYFYIAVSVYAVLHANMSLFSYFHPIHYDFGIKTVDYIRVGQVLVQAAQKWTDVNKQAFPILRELRTFEVHQPNTVDGLAGTSDKLHSLLSNLATSTVRLSRSYKEAHDKAVLHQKVMTMDWPKIPIQVLPRRAMERIGSFQHQEFTNFLLFFTHTIEELTRLVEEARTPLTQLDSHLESTLKPIQCGLSKPTTMEDSDGSAASLCSLKQHVEGALVLSDFAYSGLKVLRADVREVWAELSNAESERLNNKAPEGVDININVTDVVT